MLRRDLRAAGIPPDGFCFHSLRHTFISGVVASGASIKVCMELARHSKPDLTFRRYSHSQAEDRSKAVERFAHILPTGGCLNGAQRDVAGVQNCVPARPNWTRQAKPAVFQTP